MSKACFQTWQSVVFDTQNKSLNFKNYWAFQAYSTKKHVKKAKSSMISQFPYQIKSSLQPKSQNKQTTNHGMNFNNHQLKNHP